jgi:hypothetical protein
MARESIRSLKQAVSSIGQDFKLAQEVLHTIEPNIIRYKASFNDEGEVLKVLLIQNKQLIYRI